MTAPDRAAYIQGLRMLASALEDHPGLPLPYAGQEHVPVSWFFHTDAKSEMAAMLRAIRRAGWVKQVRDDDDDPALARFDMAGKLGGLHLRMTAFRDAVCTKVVTGTREVTEDVPDPEALAAVPTKTVTRTVESVEWQCHPILAADPGPVPAEGSER